MDFKERIWAVNIMLSRYERGRVTFDNPIQRGVVWRTMKHKSSYMCNIFKGIATFAPPILASVKIKENTPTYDIIDGKQRLLTIISYVNNEFTIVNDEEKSQFICEGVVYNIGGKRFKRHRRNSFRKHF